MGLSETEEQPRAAKEEKKEGKSEGHEKGMVVCTGLKKRRQ